MAYDLLSEVTPRVVFIGAGTRGPFTFSDNGTPIRVRDDEFLVVRRYSSTTDEDGELLVLNTDYTANVTNVDNVTITLTSAQAVLASTERLVVERSQPIVGVVQYASGGNFSGPALSDAISVHSEQIQELRRDLDRSIRAHNLDSTVSTFPLKASATSGDLLAFDDDKNLTPVTPSDIGITSVNLGSGWGTVLALPAPGSLDNLSGVRFVATYAALTALTTATGLSDNSVYYTYARLTEEDGGEGFWRYDSASTATANGGTILAIDGGGAGRFFRLYDNATVTPEWFGADGTATNDTAAWLILRGLGKAVEGQNGRTYKIKSGITITADHFKIRGNGCTFEIQDGTGGFDTKDITLQFNNSSSNTCVFYGLSREGLEFEDIVVTQAGSNERVIQIIGIQGGHASYPLRIKNVTVRGMRSGRSYISVSSIGAAGYHIDDISSKLCTISGTDWTGGTPDVGLVVIDSDLLAGVKSTTGYLNNINGEDSSFYALAPSQTFTASSSSGLLLTVTSDIATGTALRFTTTTTLPTGLSLATTYYAIRVSATTIRVATSLANALAGTAIAYTNAGTGTHTLATASASLYGDQSDVLTLAGGGNTHGPVVNGVRGKNVFEVVDCFATKAVISNVEGEDCNSVLKFVHGASGCSASTISGKGISGAVVSFNGSSVSGVGDTNGNVVTGVTGSSFGTGAVGILFQNNTGTTGIPKNNRVSNAVFTAGAGNAPQSLVKSNIPATFANTFTASSSSGLLLTAANDFDTGQAVVFTTTGTLPTGLSLATTYYLIRISSTTTKVATSLANAVAGTAIAYTNAGTGVHTMTVTNACNNFVDGVDGRWTTAFCDVVVAATCRIRASNPTHAVLRLSGTQTFTTAVEATLAFNTVVFDQENIADTANTRVIVKRPGRYLVEVKARLSGVSSGDEYRLSIYQDTSPRAVTSAGAVDSTNEPHFTAFAMIDILESDIGTSAARILAKVYQANGSDRQVLSTANYTEMSITRAA